ncbi:hypothetical protein THAOC_24935 [Thalassiosira oceanica]|uniref:Uncharacterized protein n=1 Tax=Thalassiosira oceanica TaxID=159749 RepID=K0RSL2_THAOC|nr:hypothetical protein THAOC_24935 [Thalassiosira oceanica]|eukprot:EJK55339.1 hypothetical protein THAOC_24935 [Thalassiosira oceanica]
MDGWIHLHCKNRRPRWTPTLGMIIDRVLLLVTLPLAKRSGPRGPLHLRVPSTSRAGDAVIWPSCDVVELGLYGSGGHPRGVGRRIETTPWFRAACQRCRRGAAEEPSTDIGPEGGVMFPDGHAALQGLSSIPHLTSVAAGFYRNDINGSGTLAVRARSMMSEFAVAPACLIDR